MNDGWTEADDAIEEIREIRCQIWARFDNDPKQLVRHYIERDKQHVGLGSRFLAGAKTASLIS